VSRANVGRQLFSTSDVSQNKAALLIHRVNAFYGSPGMPHRRASMAAASIAPTSW
jgi:hypothetical protein